MVCTHVFESLYFFCACSKPSTSGIRAQNNSVCHLNQPLYGINLRNSTGPSNTALYNWRHTYYHPTSDYGINAAQSHVPAFPDHVTITSNYLTWLTKGNRMTCISTSLWTSIPVWPYFHTNQWSAVPLHCIQSQGYIYQKYGCLFGRFMSFHARDQ